MDLMIFWIRLINVVSCTGTFPAVGDARTRKFRINRRSNNNFYYYDDNKNNNHINNDNDDDDQEKKYY